jgi:UDP-N-acetylmuramyl pentapeptide phosphotransferase/UDP-N-acetylglucosamine-1-phosphate transferase
MNLTGPILAYAIVGLMTPILIRLAIKLKYCDMPSERKRHKNPMPLCGGLSIFIGFYLIYLSFIPKITAKSLAIFAASILIIGIGIIDDWYKTKGKEFSALPKFIVQILAAAIVYRYGVIFHGFENPITHEFVLLPVWLKFVLTVTWIFGVTTVINFSDGMDGLAGGMSAISAATLYIVAAAKGQSDSALIAMILTGAILGFMRYNRHPAKVFLGDSGATFLGFILGVISIDGAFKQVTVISMLIPILALGVPIFDNVFVVIKRALEKKPIYKADRSQMHFRLESQGLTPKYIVRFMWLISLCSSLLSIVILLLKV